ncbi:MaoC family dehydratase [Castellaniella sp. UC4442_H9]|jgi:acyl dehydratase
MAQAEVLFLDDLAVGAEFHSAEHSLTEAQIHDFARQFDPQPFHLDNDAAKASFFQGLAASGWHTAALTMKLLVGSLPLGSGIIGAGGEIQWPRPTRPGDVLRVTSKVLEIKPSRSKPDRGIVTVECLTRNQHGDVCQRMVTRLLVMRRPE